MTPCRHVLSLFICGICLAAPQVAALELELPAAAQLTAERTSQLDSFEAPLAAFDGSGVRAVSLEGAIARRAWRINLPGLTPLQIMQPLRQQLQDLGYDVVFECEAATCGGFDFRFNIEVLPGPNMYVNISRYRYLTALKGDPLMPDQAVSILATVTAGASYLQVITAQTGHNEAAAPLLTLRDPGQDDEAPLSLGERLRSEGRVILEGLEFATASSDLGQRAFASLSDLAAFLQVNRDMRIALVGHTDNVGALGANISISRARAQSVRKRLIDAYGADPAQLDAEGMGYLAPIAPNTTAEGRNLNRRVEAVLLNTQ